MRISHVDPGVYSLSHGKEQWKDTQIAKATLPKTGDCMMGYCTVHIYWDHI